MNFQFSIPIRKILLICIIILAFILRMYSLGKVPISPDWDEASLGYNAYSILHTGKDEYGKFLPVIFRSFDDYKPGLYVYLTVPFVALFGLNAFAVRFPAAIIGVLAVIGTYFLIRELFPKARSVYLPELSAFMFAISPWHLQFSRLAFEAGVGVACNIFTVLFFLKGLKNRKYFFLSVLFLALGMNVYQSERVFAPLLFALLSIIYWKNFFVLPKRFISSLIIFLIILNIPFFYFAITNKNAFARAKGVLIFNDPSSSQLSSKRLIVDNQINNKLGFILDNRRVEFTKTVMSNYLSHFDFNWLFITGDISRHHAPGVGLLYLWELPFILIGIYQLIFEENEKKSKLLIVLWFLFVPIPASITSGVPHAVRTINFLPLYQLFSALGLVTAVLFIKSKLIDFKYVFYLFIMVYLLFIIFNLSYYFNQYYVQQNYFNAIDWQYGYEKMVGFVKANANKYKYIMVSNQPYMDQSYIFFLFYLQYDPFLYQKESLKASGGFKEDHAFNKYRFQSLSEIQNKIGKNILYIGRASDFGSGNNIIYQVNFPDGTPAMEAVEGQ